MAVVIRLPWQSVESMRVALAALPSRPSSVSADAPCGPAVAGPEALREAWLGFASRFAPLDESAPARRWSWHRREAGSVDVTVPNSEESVPAESIPSWALECFARKSPAIDEGEIRHSEEADAMREAERLYQLNDYAAAEAVLDAVLSRHPDHDRALFRKARIRHEKKDLNGALALYAEACALNPSSADYSGYFAMALSHSGRHREALESFHHAVELDPRSSHWCFYLGVEYYGQVLLPEARYYLKAAIRLLPYNLAAYRYLADVYEKVNEPLNAVETLRQAIRILPDDAYSRDKIAGIYVSLGWYEAAIREYDAWMKVDPKQSAACHAKKAACYEGMGKFEQAEGEYRKANALNPDSPTVKAKLLSLPVHLLKTYEDLVVENPSDEVARYELAQTYLKLGGWREAYAQYVALLSIDQSVAAQLLDDIVSRYPVVKGVLVGES